MIAVPQYQAQWLQQAAHGAPARLRQARVLADSPQAVAAVLGVLPAQLVSVRALHGRWPPALRRRRPRLSLRLFSQELAVLLDAGITLPEALETLRERATGPARPGAWQPAAGDTPLDRVIAALHDGHSPSAALAQVPEAFDALFIALVGASERSGQLAVTLRDHAAYLAWAHALATQLRAALVYPLLLLAAGGLVILFLLLYVLPRFAGVFDGLGRELPAASRWLMELGLLAAAHPVLLLGTAAALPVLALLALRSQAWQRALGAALWRSPGLGPRLRLVALARLYRVLGLSLAAGVPVASALGLVAGLLPPPLQAALARVQQQVRSGLRLSQALAAQGLATPVALRMLRVGESSGTVPAMLQRAAGFHDEEIASLSALATRLVNPALMLVMGLVIGGIVVLMYLPIFTLMEQVQ